MKSLQTNAHYIYYVLSSRHHLKPSHNQSEMEGEFYIPCGVEVTGNFSRIR